MAKTMLVTGGAGFIGSNFIRYTLQQKNDLKIINLDLLAYAGNLENLKDVAGNSKYTFIKGDIADSGLVEEIMSQGIDYIVNFAAESHVDRSILAPGEFVRTNILGTFTLLESCRKYWKNQEGKLFHHVSTDEVYGSLGSTGCFTEETCYDPSSPYSASKASSDHLAKAYYRTYGLPVIITNCSNNYGPFQFPEKLIPLMILNALEGKPLPVYGRGDNIRDWLFVEDHCEAIWTVIEKGRIGETYNIGGNNQWKNIDMVNKICELLAAELDRDSAEFQGLITFVPDRPGHDLRYAIDPNKIRTELGWEPKETFETGLRKTVKWYLDNQEWVQNVKTGEYQKWLEQNYVDRVG